MATVRDDVLAAGFVALVGLMIASLALWRHRRPVDVVVTLGMARGRPGLALHPWRGHWLTEATGVLLVGLIVLGGAAELWSGDYAIAGFLLFSGLLLVYIGWCRLTGRAGDGTVTLTRDGIHKLYAGSEVFIEWEDVCGLVTSPTDFIVETTRPVEPVLHMPRLLGRRRVWPDAVALPRGSLPPLPFQEMVWLYSTNPRRP
jgi:hypothetical protein